jgi:chemotaxis protein MotA
MRRRDLSTTLGLFLGSLAIIIGIGINGGRLKLGNFSLFWDISSIFITVFGSFFTIMISFPMSVVKNIPAVIKNAFIDKNPSSIEIIRVFVDLSKRARKDGLLKLENQIYNIEDDFLRSGIQMVVDSLEHQTIRNIMEYEIEAMEKRHVSGINLFKSWAGYGPAYGMIGALIGLVQMLANLSDPAAIGPGMAKAIIAILYGSVMANFVFGPLANKLEIKSCEEVSIREIMLEGVLALQEGVNPRLMEDKLKIYLSPEERIWLLNEDIKGNVVQEDE